MIEVVKQGFYSTIQDLGRTEFFQFGVPLGGCMDKYAAGLANLILDNSNKAALIEMTLSGGWYKFYCDTSICLVGAECQIRINDRLIKHNKRIEIRANDVLKIGSFKKGARLYLGVQGGIQSPLKLNSRSYIKGINDNALLINGTQVEISNTSNKYKSNGSVVMPNYLAEEILDVYQGPEFDVIDNFKAFEFSAEYEISSHDRMAYILNSPYKHTYTNMLSSPVFPGTVQLYPSGVLCVLMRDAQVTGGYPRVLVLSDNAINILAQKQQKDHVRFRLVGE